MGKNTNPADAFRKAQRKKELRKNKATRKNTRDFTLVKRDTWDLQDEIERLEGASKPDDHDKARLAELKAELENINKKKAEWVEEHPEHRRLVYRPRKETDTTKLELEMLMAKPRRNYFLPNGLPRHPERSVYYDPVMNPYGVAPPGMPYRERDLLPGEVDSEAEDSDGDIAMPEGPPPNGEDPIGSDEDIPMPEGLPPGQDQDIPMPHVLSMPPPDAHSMPLPPGIQPSPGSISAPFIPPHFFPQNVPPPPNFIHGMPTPPLGFFPRAIDPGSSQGSFASLPIQSIRGHQSHASLPPKPTFATPASTTAIVSAAPQLRDLKKEATSFVPASLKKKKASTMVASSRINAAPGTGADDDDDEINVAPRPNLLSALQDQFGPGPSVSKATANAIPPRAAAPGKSEDDYARFVEEMGNILPSK